MEKDLSMPLVVFIKRLATHKVIQRKVSITDAASFYEAVKNESLVNVYFVSADDITNMISNSAIGDLIKNAPAQPGIFSAHHLQQVHGKIEMRPYSSAKYLVNQISTDPVPATDVPADSHIYKDVSTIPEKKVKNGSFIIVPYDYASSKSGKAVTKRLVAIVTNVVNDCDCEVQYTIPVTKRRVKLNPNDKGIIKRSDIQKILSCPALKRGVYEFNEDLEIDLI